MFGNEFDVAFLTLLQLSVSNTGMESKANWPWKSRQQQSGKWIDLRNMYSLTPNAA